MGIAAAAVSVTSTPLVMTLAASSDASTACVLHLRCRRSSLRAVSPSRRYIGCFAVDELVAQRNKQLGCLASPSSIAAIYPSHSPFGSASVTAASLPTVLQLAEGWQEIERDGRGVTALCTAVVELATAVPFAALPLLGCTGPIRLSYIAAHWFRFGYRLLRTVRPKARQHRRIEEACPATWTFSLPHIQMR